MTHDIDVLVVGAGPVGSALAADMLRRDLRVRLIDKAPHAFEGSRAKGVQPRTQEVFEDLGVLAEAHAEGGTYPLLGIHLGPITVPWRMQRRYEPTPEVPHPNILLLPQSRTDAILHRLLDRLGLRIEFGVALEGFEQDGDGVTATLSSGERVRSKYLVGADGGGSAVRKSAGLQFAGETDQSDRTLIVDATIDGLSRKRWHVWPRPGGRFVGACPLPHSEQFQLMFRLKPEEAPEVDEAALAARFHSLTGLRLRDVTWTSVFRPNIRIVEHYRAGRVFVAGDAAHVHTPAGAQGLNTGVQDAYNLGWKLGQVIAGAPDSLLDSYEAERRPVAARVLGRSTELYAGLDQRKLASLKRGDEERQIGLSYRGGPLAPADGLATKTLQVGDRAPDAPCTGPGVSRLFDAYRGPHFTLLAFGPTAIGTLPELAWPDGGAELRCYAVRSEGDGDQSSLADTTGQVARIYGITGDVLILIRPDGYIGNIIGSDWSAGFAATAKGLAP
ncbi:FAD-dependent monooxygenase [Streptomyces sp. SID13031]|uniref:FAD-dependent monooxygenase n=1 Tax=Streptomyces sp. SID13031 TaxID=2706046 RepID=UPI0013C6DBBF|nr:FAD-binding monooxygenase [Streptomyces sp. SID13031]